MKLKVPLFFLFLSIFLVSSGDAATNPKSGPKTGKFRLLVVSSYHKGYEWATETNAGLCAALLKFRYFDNQGQIDAFAQNDMIETSRMLLKKLWMDSKRRSSEGEMRETAKDIYLAAREFNPHLILLGDDPAGQYVGREFLDTPVPVVFWGLNNTPVKYGLVDSLKEPGHNATGVYQSGRYADSLRLLKRLAPRSRTFAVLSFDAVGPRSHYKAIEHLARTGGLPLKLRETVATEEFAAWKQKAMELQKKVDAFFVISYVGLKDEKGRYVPEDDVARWYLANVRIPETSLLRLAVKQGMLCGVEDSGYDQGFEAIVIANDILTRGAKPATYPPRSPKRGIPMINKKRAEMLGVPFKKEPGMEEYGGTVLLPAKGEQGDG